MRILYQSDLDYFTPEFYDAQVAEIEHIRREIGRLRQRLEQVGYAVANEKPSFHPNMDSLPGQFQKAAGICDSLLVYLWYTCHGEYGIKQRKKAAEDLLAELASHPERFRIEGRSDTERVKWWDAIRWKRLVVVENFSPSPAKSVQDFGGQVTTEAGWSVRTSFDEVTVLKEKRNHGNR